MYADLHLHSTFSDGTDTPAGLFELAAQNELKMIAISDHDSIQGVKVAIDSGLSKKYDVKLIPAIEISTILHRRYLHILGYYIDINHDDLALFILKLSSEKTENTRINFENAKLKRPFSYTWERVLKLNINQPRISGVHVVEAMQHDGVSLDGMSLWDMFHKYFWAESPDFIETEKSTAYDAIDVIKKAGGIPVIAHPKSVGNDLIVVDLINYGVEGIEVFHPIHLNEDTERYKSIAIDNKLYITGGSDWHGNNNDPGITHIGMTGLDHCNYGILKVRT